MLVWDTESKRLRVVFPVPCEEPSWLGEAPFGSAEPRFDAARTDWSQWAAHQKEYPILHWVQHRLVKGGAVALFTEGLPCVRWQPERFDLSPLRSPEWEFCAVAPAHYELWDIDGERDAGQHTMRWSLWPAVAAQEMWALTATYANLTIPGNGCPLQCRIEIGRCLCTGCVCPGPSGLRRIVLNCGHESNNKRAEGGHQAGERQDGLCGSVLPGGA